MIPLFTSGLHCGFRLAYRLSAYQGVIPLFTSGLHCGAAHSSATAAANKVIPLFTSGSIAALKSAVLVTVVIK